MVGKMRLFPGMILILAITSLAIAGIFLVFYDLNVVNFFSLLLLILCLLVVISILIYWFVILPIRRLNTDLKVIGRSGLLSGRVRSGRDDEIGEMAASINEMLTFLEKAMEERSITEQRLSRFIALAEEGICLVGPDHKIWFANPKIASLFSTTPSALTGCTIESLFKDDLSADNISTLFSDQPERHEYHTRRMDGREIYLNIIMAPYPLEKDQNGYLCVFSDITPFKETERALLLSNKKLGLMGIMTRHDIVNQLITIRGMLDLMHLKITDKKLLSMIDTAEEAASIINKHIEFSKEYQMAGMQAPVWQNLKTVVMFAYSLLERNGLSISFNGDNFEIYADQLLMKVFYNLIDNSVKHGKTVLSISIKTEMTEGGLSIAYEDDGCGIVDSMKERIFERGVGSGTGWGLFFVREVLSLTGISIKEEGHHDSGVRFVMIVPDGGFRKENPDINEKISDLT